jgi:hypothetical protein
MAKKDKKKRKQNQQKIPRDLYVYGNVTKEVKSLTVTFDPVTQQLHIPEIDPSSIRRQITHKREGKDDKILYSAPASDFSMSLGDFAELKTRFDYLMAVDTNTLTDIYQGFRVSVCSIYIIKDHLSSVGSEVQYDHHASFMIFNSDHEAKSEPIGWHLAITQSIEPKFLNSSRIGIIVDSELGKHVDINSGKEPYYSDNLLPPSLKLLYASSDKSATYANDMIRLCDTAATLVLDEFKRVGVGDVLSLKSLKVGTALCFPVISTHPDENL